MFKKQNTKVLSVVMIVMILLGGFSVNKVYAGKVKGDPGLLIIAHGAPMPEWNKPVLALEDQVIKALGKNNPFKKVKVCMMEFASPTVADGVAEMEKARCDRIVVVPLLIAPSSHSHWDIPVLLGLYWDPEKEKELKAEGRLIARSKVPITIVPTLCYGDVLPQSMLARVMEMSKNPKDEAVIVLAHGDRTMEPFWCSMMRRITSYICGKTGISYADWAFVEMGQGYHKAASAIVAAGRHRKRIIVIGCYLSMGVTKMHRLYLSKLKKMHCPNPFTGINIVTADRGVLPDPMVARWIAETAKKAIHQKE